jgi:hypothetical protein
LTSNFTGSTFSDEVTLTVSLVIGLGRILLSSFDREGCRVLSAAFASNLCISNGVSLTLLFDSGILGGFPFVRVSLSFLRGS